MKEINFNMPPIGESILEVSIIKWFKKEGEIIQEEESLLEVATDKIDTEVPIAYKGVLKKIIAQPGDTVPIGAPLAIIQQETDTTKISRKQNQQETTIKKYAQAKQSMPNYQETNLEEQEESEDVQTHISPLVRNVAKKHKIMHQLKDILGTGKNQKITKRDILAYLEKKKKNIQEKRSKKEIQLDQTKYIQEGDQIIPMSRIRKITAERMAIANQNIPQVTSFIEADVSSLVEFMKNARNLYEENKHEKAIKLTYTPFFIRAIVETLKEYPLVNSLFINEQIIQKKHINVGIAVAIENNQLIVPVLHKAEEHDTLSLAKKLQELIKKVNQNSLQMEDLEGGTYTFSNIGSFKSVMGTPIILPPQVSILAIGSIEKKAAVVTGSNGEDKIKIRNKVYLSHTYDHRIIDGALGGRFVKKVAETLEDVTRIWKDEMIKRLEKSELKEPIFF